MQPSWPSPPPPPPRRRPTPSTNGTSAATADAPSAPPPPRAPAAQGDAVPVIPPPPGAKEVDDAPVPVAEFGGEGAEEDAGAEVRIGPPWDGMKRDRRSVARAADRRLRLLSA